MFSKRIQENLRIHARRFSRETRDNTCLYPNANLKYLLNDIAESKDLGRKWRKYEEREISDAARRGRVQNLLLLRRIAIGDQTRD